MKEAPRRAVSRGRSRKKAHKAYLVAPDGTRTRLKGTSLVVDLGHASVKIDLIVEFALLAKELPIRIVGDGVLLVTHGDATSVCIAVDVGDGDSLEQ